MKRRNIKYLKQFKIIGNNIRTLRMLKKISQEELAFRIASTRNYIGCIERAEKFPSICMLLDIASVLECSINDIFQDA